jgi:hypothetical protein
MKSSPATRRLITRCGRTAGWVPLRENGCRASLKSDSHSLALFSAKPADHRNLDESLSAIDVNRQRKKSFYIAGAASMKQPVGNVRLECLWPVCRIGNSIGVTHQRKFHRNVVQILMGRCCDQIDFFHRTGCNLHSVRFRSEPLCSND